MAEKQVYCRDCRYQKPIVVTMSKPGLRVLDYKCKKGLIQAFRQKHNCPDYQLKWWKVWAVK